MIGHTNMLKAHWQAIARSVWTDVSSSDNLTINRQERIISGSLPVAGSIMGNPFSAYQ